jgi:hypothetical protein
MPKFGITQTVQAKLDPTGTYLLYRISGNGRDRCEPRKVTDVESGVNHTYGRAGSFPLTKARATPMGWPAALTEYSWTTGQSGGASQRAHRRGLDWLG